MEQESLLPSASIEALWVFSYLCNLGFLWLFFSAAKSLLRRCLARPCEIFSNETVDALLSPPIEHLGLLVKAFASVIMPIMTHRGLMDLKVMVTRVMSHGTLPPTFSLHQDFGDYIHRFCS